MSESDESDASEPCPCDGACGYKFMISALGGEREKRAYGVDMYNRYTVVQFASGRTE